LHRLFDGAHEDKAYNLCMQFIGYKMNQTDDIATHVEKLKNIWEDLKVELYKDENNNLLLMCRIVETLPSAYFSFAASWRWLNKAERTVDNLTDQLCSYEKALAGKTEPVQQEALFAKSHAKPVQKLKKPAKGSKSAISSNTACHYCTQEGHVVYKCEKWIADGRPPKPKHVQDSQSNYPGLAHSISMLAVHSEALAADSSVTPDNWFVDNGATCHLTVRRDMLSDFKPFSELKSLQVADGNRVEAGTAYLNAADSGQQHVVELNNVWYVPKLSRNLFSVLAAKDKNENNVFIFTSRICNLHVEL
jgi:gag-polypeptide of LTR copia-type